jgi:hypothetical protein
VANDFDGDGKQDLAYVVVGSPTGEIGFQPGNGDGTFQPPRYSLLASQPPNSLITADFNKDGRADLAYTNAGQNFVGVVLGNGDGTFAMEAHYTVGKEPEDVKAGDFNHDGILDLATANYLDGTVSILLGVGDGTFLPAQSFAAVNPFNIALADLNGDGNLDVITAVYQTLTAGISVALGNGDGTFQTAKTYGAFYDGIAVAAGDFNGDGHMDVALVENVGQLILFLGTGDGRFQSTPVLFDTPDHALGLLAGSFNNDHRTDLAVIGSVGVGLYLTTP